jgi:hypothetical protein
MWLEWDAVGGYARLGRSPPFCLNEGGGELGGGAF